jgi:hypothetical protein
MSGQASTNRLAIALITAAMLSGCDTSRQLLQLERDSLQQVVTAQAAVRSSSSAGDYDAKKYDVHLLVGSSVFNEMLTQFDGTTFTIEQGRPVSVTLEQARFEFRPGYPSIVIKARAKDRETGIEAELALYASVLVERDASKPETMYLRIVTTRAVPNIRWGPLELGKWLFARQLMQIEAMRYAQQLPRLEVPIRTPFTVGGPAGSQTVAFPAGNATIRGVVTWPATEISGAIGAPQVLFLPNGIHIFANVEGI